MWVELGHSHVSLGKRIVGEITCEPFLKRSNHWKRALKCIYKEACA